MANTVVTDFVNDLVGEIDEGIYDKHLRRIARACYKRRGVLEDGVGIVGGDPMVPVIVETDEATKEAEGGDARASSINVGNLNVGNLVAGESQYRTAKEVYEQGPKATAQAVARGRRVGGSAFRWNGVRYWSYLIDGRRIYFDNSCRHRWLRSTTVEVVRVYTEGTSHSVVRVIASDHDPQDVGSTRNMPRTLLMKRLLQGEN